jgi:hypothetical protein
MPLARDPSWTDFQRALECLLAVTERADEMKSRSPADVLRIDQELLEADQAFHVAAARLVEAPRRQS